MSFSHRSAIGEAWDKEVTENLSVSFHIVSYGIEKVARNLTGMARNTSSDNACIRSARYLPDGLAADLVNNIAFYWDAKAAKAIEKDAFIAYSELAGSNKEFYIFIKFSGIKYCVPLKYVEFFDSKQYVERFTEQLPVDSEGWIAPRLLPESKYFSWKERSPLASGTPCKYFDFGKMNKWQFNWPFEYQELIQKTIVPKVLLREVKKGQSTLFGPGGLFS